MLAHVDSSRSEVWLESRIAVPRRLQSAAAMDSQAAAALFTPRLHGKGPPHRCLGDHGNNPCHVCRAAPQVYPNAVRCPYWDGMAPPGPGLLLGVDVGVSDYTPSILVTEGFDNIDIQELDDVRALLGLEGGIVLNTMVIAHACPTVAAPPYQYEFFVIIGVNGAAVTLTDVTIALRSIPRDAFQRGRSYYWEGVTLSPSRRFARIEWGS